MDIITAQHIKNELAEMIRNADGSYDSETDYSVAIWEAIEKIDELIDKADELQSEWLEATKTRWADERPY